MPVDYFAFFGLERKLNLDVARLEKSFHQLSRNLHPDLHARLSAEEQAWSLEQSSLLNDAYRALKDPILRTQYLLQLEGVELEEQSKSATEKARATGEAKKQIVPPDMLEEVFELNMQLEEMRANKKLGEADPALTQELEQHKRNLEQKHEELLLELRAAWDRWDAVGGQNAEEVAAVRDRMVDILNRRNYVRNLVRDVNETLEN